MGVRIQKCRDSGLPRAKPDKIYLIWFECARICERQLNKEHNYREKLMQQYDLAIPILPSRSIPATVAFYHRFGFEGGAHAFNGNYAILNRGSIELHFFTHQALVPAESSASCYIRVMDVQNIYQTFTSSNLPSIGIPRMDALEDKPWGLREFAVVDLDGNLLRVGEVINK